MKVGLLQADMLVKVVGFEAVFLEALLLLDATLKGLSLATAKLKLIKVKAGKRLVVQQAGGKAP